VRLQQIVRFTGLFAHWILYDRARDYVYCHGAHVPNVFSSILFLTKSVQYCVFLGFYQIRLPSDKSPFEWKRPKCLSQVSGQKDFSHSKLAFTIPTVRGAVTTMELSKLCQQCQLIDFDTIFDPGRSIPPINGLFIVALEKLQYDAACPACCLFDSIALELGSVWEK
jgi:hypothetical protein